MDSTVEMADGPEIVKVRSLLVNRRRPFKDRSEVPPEPETQRLVIISGTD